MVVACVFLIFSCTDGVGGNGYLAVYIAGLIFGNSRVTQRKNTARFFDGFAWLWQIVMFMTLGLLVNPSDLVVISGFGLFVGAFMILIGRPVSVLMCLFPFKSYSKKGLTYEPVAVPAFELDLRRGKDIRNAGRQLGAQLVRAHPPRNVPDRRRHQYCLRNHNLTARLE